MKKSKNALVILCTLCGVAQGTAYEGSRDITLQTGLFQTLNYLPCCTPHTGDPETKTNAYAGAATASTGGFSQTRWKVFDD